SGRLRPEGAHPRLDDRVATVESDRADLLEYAHDRQLVGEHQTPDERHEGSKLALPPLALASDRTPKGVAHGLRIDPELSRDGPVAFAIALELLDQLISPLPALSLSPAPLLADPSSVMSREAISSAVRSCSERIARSVAESAIKSRRLVSV